MSPVRAIIRFLAVIVVFSGAQSAARADQSPRQTNIMIDVSADRLGFYTDQKMIEARGNVRLNLSNGVTVQGDACVVDLSLQRFVVAGHVSAVTPAGRYVGAAFADFLSFDRVYFIPLDALPDRWTFLNSDYAHPEKGREMPGDAFFLPDFSAIQPFIVGKSARIVPGQYVQFAPARFVFLNGGISTPPLPIYVRNYSDNPNFSVNSLSGATYDVPYGFAGTSHSLETLHFRHDQRRKTYGSIEHHTVFGDYGYVVVSLNPATQAAKQWNLTSYVGNGTNAVNLNAQLFTYQYGLSQPLSSNGFIDVQQTHTLPGSALRFEATQSYDSFLAPTALGYYGDPSHPFTPNHPLALGVAWFGFDKSIARTGLTFRLASGLSFLHDAFGVSTSGKKDANSSYAGALLYTPVYRAPFGTGANATYQLQRTWLSFPNKIDTQTLAVSDSKRFSNKFALTASLLVQSAFVDNPNALYGSPSRVTGLVPQPESPNGLPLVGGVVTQLPGVRNSAFVVTAAWAPSPNFQFLTAAQENHYSPVQQPFVGGPPRYQVFGDVRTRLSKTLFLDVGRTYYFNWGNQRWSPSFALQVSAQ